MAIITDAMQSLDSVGINYVNTSYNTLAAIILPIAKVFFSIAIGWFAIEGMIGRRSFSLATMFKLVAMIVLVYAVLSNRSIFQTYFVDIVINLPGQIGKVLFTGFSGSSTPEDGIQQAWDTGWVAYSAVFAQAGLTALGPAILALFIALGNVFFCVVAFFIISFGKMFAYILLALAPVFIVCLVFDWTRNWFMSYINALFHTMVLLMLAYSIIGIFLFMMSGAISALESAGSGLQAKITNIAPYLFFMILGGLFFIRVPAIAAMLAGGIALDVASGIGNALANTATRGAASAGRGAKQGFQAGRSAMQRSAKNTANKGRAGYAALRRAVESSRSS